jgi:hypothetical protein
LSNIIRNTIKFDWLSIWLWCKKEKPFTSSTQKKMSSDKSCLVALFIKKHFTIVLSQNIFKFDEQVIEKVHTFMVWDKCH